MGYADRHTKSSCFLTICCCLRALPAHSPACRFNKLKPTCLLINVSRGGLINTNALIDALESNKLGGVAMDV